MLSQLHIENIAVIQKATIPFTSGLNVFTGETGAGKTILISAIDAVLGERTSRDIIRSGEDRAVVSALFDDVSSETKEIIEQMGFEMEDSSLLIYREMTASGRNVCRVNGMPANVTMLKEISQHLINIHGQRDTGQLLNAEQHLELIDIYGELQPSIDNYATYFGQLKEKQAQLNELDMDESQKAQRLDMLGFQIEEIKAAHLHNINEEDELLAQRKIIAGSEKIRQGLSTAYGTYIGNGELPGIEELLAVFIENIEQAADHMESLLPLLERLNNIKYDFSDIANEVQFALDDLDFDPIELDKIENRLDTIYNLKRKYGSSIEEILEHYEKCLQEYDSINLSDKKAKELERQIKELEDKCTALAKKLSDKRSFAARGFTDQVESELAFLDMPSVKLSIKKDIIGLTATGCDQIEFMIVTNIGEEPKPLSKIASGGEMARIMLAIKNVLADRDNIDTLIFDEIDTGVSGKAAGKIGRKLYEVSKSRQVLCVTHLAQVAAFADNHLHIYKTTEDNRTFTKVKELKDDEIIQELARITSGEVVTTAALQSAKELVQRARQEEL